LSSKNSHTPAQTYFLDENSFLLKKENVAPPPEDHHRLVKSDRVFFIDAVPNGAQDDARRVNRVTDESHHSVADIQGSVIYVTGRGEIYTRVGEREVRVYNVNGSQLGKIELEGLSSACASIRFDSDGSIYELDGIPDQEGHYTAAMPGMRL